MTLLVLAISVPDDLDARAYEKVLQETMTQLWAYFLSFVIIAVFWRSTSGSSAPRSGWVRWK
ncbi:TMEM175 family protein [Streptomyces sp. NPDC006925]|uniref:TMEM175 family protein n=1 Tax=Streptomyces sp. NPDC006925 TaxID=3364768 RepID=UPI00369C0F40